jgi:predicted lipid-binding transport protein (Tim44 family)
MITAQASANEVPWTALIPFLCMGLLLLWQGYMRKHKIHKAHQRAKQKILSYHDAEKFWDETVLDQKIEEKFYQIHNAWSDQDIDTLKTCLSPRMLDAFSIKINWQQYRHENHVHANIQLLDQKIVESVDKENNADDYFWVYLEASMSNRILNENQEMIQDQDHSITEYWKFIRKGYDIYLDEIRTPDQYML